MSILFAAALTAAAPPAPASPVPPPPPVEEPSEIVVTGRKDQDKQVRQFVKALTDMPGTDPLARFDLRPTCPTAVGLTDALDAAITARLRTVAKAAGIELGAPGCTPNALVLFAPDKREMVRALRKAHPSLFTDATDEMVKVPDEAGPATAWYLETRVDSNGVPLSFNSSNGYYVLETSASPSLLNASARPVLRGSVVVIEQEATVGLTTTQVADYAAMRAFARLNPARLSKGNAPTILRALGAPMGSEVPNSMTRWDLSYLKGLYASGAYQHAQRQRTSIARQIKRDLEKASSPTAEPAASPPK